MFYLTDNKVEFEGHTFTQIKRQLPNGKFEFGGYVENTKNIDEDFWISKNSYMFGDCETKGKIRIGSNCIIKNSKLHYNILIDSGCIIQESQILGSIICATLIDKNCKIIRQTFKSRNRYPSFLFEDGDMITDVYNNVTLNMTNNYCKINCILMTYEMAWEYLQNEEKWQKIKSDHLKTPEVFYPDTKKWLYYWCEKQLKKKEGRAK